MMWSRVAILLLSITPFFGVSHRNVPTQTASVSWVDVAPILSKKCVTCHYPGGPSPFELSSYESASRRALLLSVVTSEGAMPPCDATSEFGSFCDTPPLSGDEILTLKRWAASGAKRGDNPPESKHVATHSDWITKPNFVTEISESVEPAIIPYWKEYTVKLPPNKGTITSVQVRRSDALTFRSVSLIMPGEGWENKSRMFSGSEWLRDALGYRPTLLPDSMGIPIKDNLAKIRVRIHPLGKPLEGRAQIGFTFGDKTVVPPRWISIGKDNIKVPPNVRDFKLRHEYKVSRTFSLLSIRPQTRLLATEIELLLTRPDKPSKKLFYTQRWNRFSMGSYSFKSPLKIEAGSIIRLTINYDNSSSNPFNPHNPPREKVSGNQLEDPSFWTHLLVNDSGDDEPLLQLVAAYRP